MAHHPAPEILDSLHRKLYDLTDQSCLQRPRECPFRTRQSRVFSEGVFYVVGLRAGVQGRCDASFLNS
jgi:hypothetical protein